MIKKKSSPKGKSIRVTFELPAEYARESVAVVGDFNEWDSTSHEMKLNEKKGVWSKSISFKPGRELQFRYLIDGSGWANEDHADAQVPNEFSSANSILRV